ncbi:LOW QUALITY PROTEIN: hypothetical protein Cgig2_000332 [Carnegiea gigantea]|uniref:Uncharacterized protein n=1 Tax=Carnegiea gigantea TaxID=171969 RepID=A0A9Q1GJE8_9CARY|nr:LOW QUALITY PROTEIN: hypothetical protein Cgig2_000332 [Carnegiea gigantea]
MATMTVNAATPPKVCVDVGQGPQTFSPVEDVGHTPSDATVTSCGEGKLGAHGPHMEQQRPDQVLRESGEEGANPEGRVGCFGDVVFVRHTPIGKGISMASELSLGTVEVGIIARTDGLGGDVMIDPSMKHGQSMTPESTDVEDAARDEACVDSLLGPSLEIVSNAEGD